MNWFQFVFLREDSQAAATLRSATSCCELISICIFTWGFTSDILIINSELMLWIDFNLYFYVRIHKLLWVDCEVCKVVNWFQFVFLREDSQVIRFIIIIWTSCELISICIFTWGFTRGNDFITTGIELWIDFNLYFYVRIHKNGVVSGSPSIVVNWFQFVFLREDSQVNKNVFDSHYRCELISICIFTWGFTSRIRNNQ